MPLEGQVVRLEDLGYTSACLQHNSTASVQMSDTLFFISFCNEHNKY